MDDLIVDVGRREVLRGTDALPISGLSFDLLLALIHAAPNAVAYDELIESVWAGAVVGTETVTQRAKLVRDALGDDSRSPRYIAGVRGRGYRIVAPVTELTVDAQPMPIDVTVNGAPDETTRGRVLKWGSASSPS